MIQRTPVYSGRVDREAPEHAHLVKAAIAAGKDVYSEWPLTTSTAESEEMLRLAEDKDVRHVVGLQRRFSSSASYARDLIAHGYVGTVRSVRMSPGHLGKPCKGEVVSGPVLTNSARNGTGDPRPRIEFETRTRARKIFRFLWVCGPSRRPRSPTSRLRLNAVLRVHLTEWPA